LLLKKASDIQSKINWESFEEEDWKLKTAKLIVYPISQQSNKKSRKINRFYSFINNKR